MMNLPKAMSLKTNSITYMALLLLTSDGFSPRATSTSPNSQSSKMNSIVYQKQFQSAPATVRMAQPFPTQFAPQILSQPNLVPPLVRAPHTNTFPAPVQRPPMALASQMPPPLTTGLMSHARLPHVARGPCGSLSGVRGNQAQAALKAEQDMKVSTVLTANRARICL
nr:PREDICTED: protein PRRC2C-like [Bos indicus]